MDKLLLVEDDATLIRMVRDFLTSDGFQVCAVTGQTAQHLEMKGDVISVLKVRAPGDTVLHQ